MFRGYARNWQLVIGCIRVLNANPDLLIYPIVSFVMTGMVLAVMFTGVFALVAFDIQALTQLSAPVQFVLTFLFYLVAYFIIFFANTALVGCVMLYFDGEHPTLWDGWRIARTHVRSILAYSLVMATVGMVFRWIFRRTGWIGSFLSPVVRRTAIFAVIGLAWHLIPYMVTPMIVAENKGPIQAMRDGTNLIKRTWGENVVLSVSVWFVFALPLIVVSVLGGPVIYRAILTMDPWLITGAIFGVVMLFLLSYLAKIALDGIFSAVAYRYAAGLVVDECFSSELLDHAFRARPNWLRRVWNRLRRKADVQ